MLSSTAFLSSSSFFFWQHPPAVRFGAFRIGQHTSQTLTMSVGGPCLWLPSLSSPVPSPLSAVSSHLSSARNSDRFSLGPRTISPRLSVQKKEEPSVPVAAPRFAEMQSTEYKAEDALPHAGAQPSGMAASGSFARSETSSRDTINRRLEAAKQDMLPRVKLQIPSLDQRVFSTIQPLVGQGGHSEETGVSSFAGSHDPRDDHGPESTVSPDDDKDMMGSDDNNRSPSMEKKKMRRFRYVIYRKICRAPLTRTTA